MTGPIITPGLNGGERVASGLVALGCLAVLVVSAWLTPSREGVGTHEQLRLRSGRGLQPCTWLALTGKPCPTCGMTTAFAYAANADLWSAFRAQPLGALLALATSICFWASLSGAAARTRVGPLVSHVLGRRALFVGLALLGAAWLYKVVTWGVIPGAGL